MLRTDKKYIRNVFHRIKVIQTKINFDCLEFSEIWEGEKKDAVWEASEKVRKTKQKKKKKHEIVTHGSLLIFVPM